MPLLEIVPSPVTDPKAIERTLGFWKNKDRTPLVLKKETIGFMANRLAYTPVQRGRCISQGYR